MIGFGLIIIGVIAILEALGILSGVSGGVIWGVAFIVIGVAFLVRRSSRRARRAQWVREHRDEIHAKFHKENPDVKS